MKKAASTLVLCCFSFTLALAQPHPRDSVIIESKTIAPGVGTTQAPAAFVRVYITNKDSIASLTLPLLTKSVTGGAYMTLSHPRTETGEGVANFLTSTLSWARFFNGNRYNSSSPDTFLLAALFDIANPAATQEPPNLARKPFLDIKFDSVWANAGTVCIDSALTLNGVVRKDVSFVDRKGNAIKPNFVKGTITVQPEELPCAAARLDLKENNVLEMADVVLLMNCAFLGKGNCKGTYTAADVVALLNAIFSGIPLPPGTC